MAPYASRMVCDSRILLLLILAPLLHCFCNSYRGNFLSFPNAVTCADVGRVAVDIIIQLRPSLLLFIPVINATDSVPVIMSEVLELLQPVWATSISLMLWNCCVWRHILFSFAPVNSVSCCCYWC